MGVLDFNGSSNYLKWATLAQALQDTPGGAWTTLTGVRHASLSGFQGYGYLLAGLGDGSTRMGFSKHLNGDLYHDVSSFSAYSALDPAVDEDTLFIASKAAGSAVSNATKQVGSGGTPAHQAGNSTMGTDTDGIQMQLGTWQLSDFLNGHMAVFAIWNVELSQAQRIACGANWQTSDIYNAHTTPPLVLIEMNVAAGSLVNLGSAAISSPSSNAPTLDAAQTFGGWDFDGIGGAPPDELRPRQRVVSPTVQVASAR